MENKMPGAAVTEFVIISPPEVNLYLLRVRERLRRHLAQLFPHYRFSLVEQGGEADGMGFVVVPVVGKTGYSRHPIKEVDEDVLREIAQGLERFDPSAPELLN